MNKGWREICTRDTHPPVGSECNWCSDALRQLALLPFFSPLRTQCSFFHYILTNSFILGPLLHLHPLASNESIHLWKLLMFYEMLVCVHGLEHSLGGKIIQWTDCRGEVVFISVRPAIFGVATLPKRCLCLPIAISSSTGVCAVKRA